VNINVQAQTISFYLHSELDILMDTVQVAKETSQLSWSMEPDDDVIHILEPADGITSYICYPCQPVPYTDI
jgi:hypothetical protein